MIVGWVEDEELDHIIQNGSRYDRPSLVSEQILPEFLVHKDGL